MAPEEKRKKKENKRVGGHDSNKKKIVSPNDTREPGGNFVDLGWWNRSGHSGPFIFKTRGIVD